jgi:hypothetical protein
MEVAFDLSLQMLTSLNGGGRDGGHDSREEFSEGSGARSQANIVSQWIRF